jgi:mannosylglycoprotein endo-beta-mannosidase
MQRAQAFYTFWYVADFSTNSSGCQFSTDSTALHLRGIAYSADVWLDGAQLSPTPANTTVAGMYHRFRFNLPLSDSIPSAPHRLAILVRPPPAVGKANCGQGGDHLIASNAAMSQYVADGASQPARRRHTHLRAKTAWSAPSVLVGCTVHGCSGCSVAR